MHNKYNVIIGCCGIIISSLYFLIKEEDTFLPRKYINCHFQHGEISYIFSYSWDYRDLNHLRFTMYVYEYIYVYVVFTIYIYYVFVIMLTKGNIKQRWEIHHHKNLMKMIIIAFQNLLLVLEIYNIHNVNLDF